MAKLRADLPDFGTFLVTSLMTDVSADILPDAQAVLAIVQSGGAEALLQPSNAMTLNSFLVKLQADALKTGNDLSKQIATFVSMYLANKLAPPAPTPAA